MFQIGIPQNTKCAKRDGFRREGHTYCIGFKLASHAQVATVYLA